MTSRDNILKRIEANQPKTVPEQGKVDTTPITYSSPVARFQEVLTAIGGSVTTASNTTEVGTKLSDLFPGAKRIVSTDPSLNRSPLSDDPHDFANVDVCILEGSLGVAENGAVWITDKFMLDRALPFICENLVLLVRRANILNNMAEAYEAIGDTKYEYGTFIAGPSKTADIEQSLVLGAHGPKSLIAFIIG